MRDGRVVDLDALLFAEILEFFSREVCPVVGDDVVGDTESKDYGFDEVYSRRDSRVGDGSGFNPLGELVDCNEEVGVPALRGFLQWAYHVESPRGEGPRERNRL